MYYVFDHVHLVISIMYNTITIKECNYQNNNSFLVIIRSLFGIVKSQICVSPVVKKWIHWFTILFIVQML